MAAPLGHHTHTAGTTGAAGDYPNNGVGGGYTNTAGTGAGYGDGHAGKHGGRPGMFRRDSQPGLPEYHNRHIANPSPLGLFALAATTLMWSLFNARTRHITEINAVIGMALAVGGLCQLLAGMWEFVHGNTWGSTAFTMLGGFWISYGILYWPSSGSLAAYSTSQLGSALGIYFMVWMVVSFMLLLGTFRGSVPLAGTFFFLMIMYLLIGAAHFTGRVSVLRAGGIVGCIASMLAFYTGAIGLHNRNTTYYNVPAIGLSKRRDREAADARY